MRACPAVREFVSGLVAAAVDLLAVPSTASSADRFQATFMLPELVGEGVPGVPRLLYEARTKILVMREP
jgi:hypothetical protein